MNETTNREFLFCGGDAGIWRGQPWDPNVIDIRIRTSVTLLAMEKSTGAVINFNLKWELVKQQFMRKVLLNEKIELAVYSTKGVIDSR